jgi:glucose-1-phosphate thymidylyltransferase
MLLAGGTGSRLLPLTAAVNKHLLPIYDKPMLYYPLTTLMLGGIREFVVLSSPGAMGQIQNCLGSGSRWGISFEYVTQPAPHGIAAAFLVRSSNWQDPMSPLFLATIFFMAQGCRSRSGRQ